MKNERHPTQQELLQGAIRTIERVLVFALHDDGPAGAAVRERLRPLLTAQVAQDLAESMPMLHAFLASGSLGSTG